LFELSCWVRRKKSSGGIKFFYWHFVMRLLYGMMNADFNGILICGFIQRY
jgi:hypothetical protein